jgi:MoaA/NifB/PqqE/SkfB family radical SAM enzyme
MSLFADKLEIMKNAFYRQVIGFASIPYTAVIEVNYDCMLRCKMCRLWTADFKKSRIGENDALLRADIKRAIDEFASAGIKNVCFLGGEPFLRKGLLDLIQYCNSKGLTCVTISNGFLIGEDLAKKIVLSRLDILGISIDGPRSEIHDRIRGVEGAFDRAVGAIRLIKKRQKELNTEFPEISIACTVSSNNFLCLPDMVDLARSLDVRQIRFQYISVVDQGTVERTNQKMGEQVVAAHNFVDIPRDCLVSEEQIDSLEDVLAEIQRRSGTRVECHLDPAFLDGDKKFLAKGIFPVWDCAEPWQRAYMTPTGDFMPCPMFPNYNMGNIKDHAFEEIWNNKRARSIRKRLGKGLPPICQKCCVVHSGTQSRWKQLYRRFATVLSAAYPSR